MEVGHWEASPMSDYVDAATFSAHLNTEFRILRSSVPVVDVELVEVTEKRAADGQAGIGTATLQDLLAEATRCRKPFRIHVEKFNRAQRLYERLGFSTLADDGMYLFMEWRWEVW
jgi:hypothetical protein